MWKNVVPHLELDANGFEIETQMNIRALRARLKITEVASFEAERIAGQAKLVAIPDGFRVLKQVLGEYYQMLQRRRRRTIPIGTMIRAFLGSFFLK
jgi:hypothetical protein